MNGLESVDLKTALENSARLRIDLALGLGLKDSSKMKELIDQLEYILTPDFAMRLLILNERRLIKQSVILSGDTG